MLMYIYSDISKPNGPPKNLLAGNQTTEDGSDSHIAAANYTWTLQLKWFRMEEVVS